MKIMVLLWSTSVEKRIVALSLFIFFFLGLPFFLFGLSSLSFLGQCSMNDDHHTSIYLQLKNYNSILRTRYDSIWMHPAVCRDVQWFMSDMYEKNYERWLCHKYNVNYMIMHSNMTMMKHHDKLDGGKLHANISRNGYGNAIIGRYGGFFEEDIWWVYGTVKVARY